MAKACVWLVIISMCLRVHSQVSGESLLCGAAEEIRLEPRGRLSAVSLKLENREENNLASKQACTLNILAPLVYALSIRIVNGTKNPFEGRDEIPTRNLSGKRKPTKAYLMDRKNRTSTDCMLNVVYLDKPSLVEPAWKHSPCSPIYSMKGSMSSLLSPPVRIEWFPPHFSKRTDHLRLVITAINAGQSCSALDQVVCSDSSLVRPRLCVSDFLACDGIRHCPTGNGRDEGAELCRMDRSNWMAVLVKRLLSHHSEIFGIENITVNPPEEVTTKPPPKEVPIKKKPDNFLTALETALEPYGSWGYIMLALLICAVVMIFFGVWEWLCYKPKPPPLEMPPDCVAPAAVVSSAPVFHHRQLLPPPTYDELEQPPPPYSVLFPNSNKVIILPDTSRLTSNTVTS